MTRICAIAVLGLLICQIQANQLDVSPLFELDTRPVTTAYGDFVLDTQFANLGYSNLKTIETRPWDGASDSSNSGNFTLDARTAAPVGLAITGPTSVIGGGQAAYSIQNAGVDVSIQATLGFAHAPVTFAGIGGNTLFTYPVSAPQTVQLLARYHGPGGQIQSAAYPVTILPNAALSATASANLVSVSGSVFTVAASASASGGTPPYTFNWDADFDGQFDDHAGPSTSFPITSTGETIRVRVEVLDAASARVVVSRLVALNKLPVPNEPPAQVLPQLSIGKLLEFNNLTESAPDVAKAQNGLVVIAHGLRSDEDSTDSYGNKWQQWMASSISSRIPSGSKPNVMIYSWKDGADPAQFPAEAVARAKQQMELLTFVAGFGGVELNGDVLQLLVDGTAHTSDFLVDCWFVRNNTGMTYGQHLADYLYQLSLLPEPLVVPEKPIHLIGHSAGGFLVGYCANLLKQKGIMVDQVTMLDTPFPVYEHLAPYPAPSSPSRCARRVERLITSVYGTLDTPGVFNLWPSADYRYDLVDWVAAQVRVLLRWHEYGHEWFTYETVQDVESREGFYFSPFCPNGGYPFPPKVSGGSGAMQLAAALESDDENTLPPSFVSEFQTFGNVTENGGVYVLTEASHAGIFKNVSMPVGVQAVRFAAWFSSAGDGDTLEVHFGDDNLLHTVLDLPLTRDGFLSFDAPAEWLHGQNGQLIFKLVSRGVANAVVQIKNIEIIESDDPDSDGLTTTQEQIAGTNPLAYDSDGDTLSDAAEINTYFTNPMLADSDGDGASDSAELTAGTSATNGQSFLRVTDMSKNTGGTFTLHWPSQAGRFYNVQRSADVTFATFDVIGQGVPAALPQNTFVDTSAGAATGGRFFYRIEVYMP